jgi:hypothetical protein
MASPWTGACRANERVYSNVQYHIDAGLSTARCSPKKLSGIASPGFATRPSSNYGLKVSDAKPHTRVARPVYHADLTEVQRVRFKTQSQPRTCS